MRIDEQPARRPFAVLLNPPGTQRYIRDCYCSSIDKAHYYWQPLDLLVQSGFLAADHDVVLIDAIIEGWDADRTIDRIAELAPRVVLSLTSHLSWKEDRPFFERLKRATETLLAVSGDLPRFHSEAVLNTTPWIDGVLLDIATPDLAAWSMRGFLSPDAGITHRREGRTVVGRIPTGASFGYPIPLHDLFSSRRYRFPFGLPTPTAGILLSHACPHSCTYCNTGSLHFAKRHFDEISDELAWIAGRGYRSLQVRDATFNCDPRYVEFFCNTILEMNWKVEWFCNARADQLDDPQVALMARAGCRFIAFGLETGSPALLEKHKPSARMDRSLGTLEACRRHGIETLSHILLGLPGESRDTVMQTEAFLRRAHIDFASFNVFEPRPGAELMGAAVTPDRALSGESVPLEFGDSCSRDFDRAELERWKKRFYRRFYLSPKFWARRLSRLRNRFVLYSYLRNFRQLFFRQILGLGG
ncbi:MAG: radical SAM protein [Deltaproteobacteria bacterium]|nr:radical SAM protein [Deltaproteobacteria bacterium]